MDPRRVSFPAKDEPLRQDVSVLGALVGEVLKEQGGEELFERVEAARKAAIARREGGSEGEAALERVVCDLAPRDAADLVRGFSTYFRVVNLAEKVHRIRRRRDHLREGSVQSWGLVDALERLKAAGLSRAESENLLAGLLIEPVFTAHPTESTRRTILEKEQRIARALVDRLDPSRTPDEEAAALSRVRLEITTAWQTEEHPSERPTVGDEREHVLFYLNDVIYRIVPAYYEALEEAVAAVYGERDTEFSGILRFASWVGGDMDGNPNVTAETVRETLHRHRALILGRYRDSVRALARHLSQSLSRVAVSERVSERVEYYGGLFPEALERVRPRHRDMPYRVLLRMMVARIEATHEDTDRGYGEPAELLDDLRIIEESLAEQRGDHAGRFAVRRLRRRVETFGFHLATLDVRQDALLHRRVVGRLIGVGSEEWLVLPAAEREKRIRSALASGAPPVGEPDEMESATLEVFRAIDQCRARYGSRATGPFIVSMTEGADDVLSVLLLARWAGLVSGDGDVPLDVAPLFETVGDLVAAPEIVRALFADPLYGEHLAARGRRQTIMVGYSDSNKDGGLAAARWSLQQAQAHLTRVAVEAEVDLTIFHGRGGTVSRGGGKTHRAVMAAPEGSVAGKLRMTEQGETIDAKFGLRGIAMRTLERVTASVALATGLPRAAEPREDSWRRMMETVAAASRKAYVELVYQTPEFLAYFRRATPIDLIERMRIGSRPASRRSGGGVEDLRAIPWVFSWTQSRHMLPGWYGLGSGLARCVEEHGEELVAEMVREWIFLRTLIEDAEMVLAKSDLGIAARYAALAGDVGEQLFPRIEAEHRLVVELVLRLKGAETLLEGDPTLQRSIRLRNPYVDPMSELQVDLLRRWRKTERRDGDLYQALLATVHGIAEGLQNTG